MQYRRSMLLFLMMPNPVGAAPPTPDGVRSLEFRIPHLNRYFKQIMYTAAEKKWTHDAAWLFLRSVASSGYITQSLRKCFLSGWKMTNHNLQDLYHDEEWYLSSATKGKGKEPETSPPIPPADTREVKEGETSASNDMEVEWEHETSPPGPSVEKEGKGGRSMCGQLFGKSGEKSTQYLGGKRRKGGGSMCD